MSAAAVLAAATLAAMSPATLDQPTASSVSFTAQGARGSLDATRTAIPGPPLRLERPGARWGWWRCTWLPSAAKCTTTRTIRAAGTPHRISVTYVIRGRSSATRTTVNVVRLEPAR